MKTIRKSLIYFRRSFILEVKSMLIYPGSFWFTVLVYPMYTFVQIVFVEAIYSYTDTFAGYSKFDAYVLFGTFRIVQSLAYFFVYLRLVDLKELIRGDGNESFDNVLTKPIDSQLYGTLGRYMLGNIAPLFIGIFLIWYGITKGQYNITIPNIAAYVYLVVLAVCLLYVTFLFFRSLIFWFGDLLVSEDLWEDIQEFGQYPRALYQGSTGLLWNIILPITLMASIPTETILGRVSPITLLLYTLIIAILFFLTRQFWKTSVKKYTSFSS